MNRTEYPPPTARMGLVVPSVNSVLEPYAYQVAPGGVSFHSARMRLDSPLTAETVRRMDEEHGWDAVRELYDCGPTGLAYCCTASSIVGGAAYDRELRQRIEELLGVPVTTVTQSLLAACSLLDVRRIALASPYPPDIADAEITYLTGAGLDVVSVATLGIGEAAELCDPGPETIGDLVRRAHAPGVDAIVISCVNFRGHLVAASLEREFGVPVIAATTAVVWNMLRLCGLQLGERAAGLSLAALPVSEPRDR